ncbi:MAG: metal ABC transporter permease [Planctomycetes bacterium]|nr:metal ABC transporter permease [Planctomycetota bacterium]
MGEFFRVLQQEAFVQNALAAGLLASIACGVVGTYVVVRRISYLAGGIAHAVLGGLGAAVYLRGAWGWTWLDPLVGATVAALAAAAVIGVVSLRFAQREDTVISALWAVGMAGGVILLHKTPGYEQDLTSYLFGNILIVSGGELLLIAALDLLVVALVALLYKPFLAVCFDEPYARTCGVPVQRYYLALLALTALTVVLLVTVVGIVMVIALLTLPVATVGQVARRLGHVMVGSVLLSMVLTTAGLAVSYELNLPSGAVIILLAAGLFLAALIVKALWARRRRRRATGRGPSCPGRPRCEP